MLEKYPVDDSGVFPLQIVNNIIWIRYYLTTERLDL